MAKIEKYRMHTPKGTASIVSAFRQLVSQGGIKFNFGIVSVELKEADLQRIHNIILEIDDRRVFYDFAHDKEPEVFVKSVREAKEKIHEARKGLWANKWAREIVQIMLDDIGEFFTKIEELPPYKDYKNKEMQMFKDYAQILRAEMWTAVAHLVVVFGNDVEAYHLPKEIYEEVSASYKKR